jgi:nifR3 family TIM-barrel protein
MLLIGRVRVAHPLILAPMEEHTNYPFRLLMKQHGASLVCSERVDAADVARRDRRAIRLLYTQPNEAPRAGQISGSDPSTMAEAARVIEELDYDIVDLNFECPIRRLVQRGEGGALLADPRAIEQIVIAVKRAVSIPITLKIRTGPDAERETASEIAKLAESAGAAAIDVHARTVQQAYVGGPDWSVLARVKQSVQIPVFGSGGIREPADAQRYLAESGADAAAIGRGCLGNPWIFQHGRALLLGGSAPVAPTLRDRRRVLLQLVEGEFRMYGPVVAIRRLPRVACYFAKFLPDFADFKRDVPRVENLEQFRRLVQEYF